jgi:hypothetical protein
LIGLLVQELGIVSHPVDHTAKDFQALLEESNTFQCGLVIVDGFDSHVGKRIIGLLTDHAKTSTHKILCIGHQERKTTSNSFAAKWKHFHFGVPKSMVAALATIAAGRVSDDIVKRIVRSSPSDIRSCINMLEMHLFRPGEISSRDDFVDIIDAIERVFYQHTPFDNLFKTFEHESLVISGGVHENYLRSVHDIDDVAKISESMSASDVILDKDFTNVMAYCASSVGFVNACETKKKIKIEKYGTVLSKNSQRLATKKRLSAFNFKRMEKGQQPLTAEDIGLHMGVKMRTGKLF